MQCLEHNVYDFVTLQILEIYKSHLAPTEPLKQLCTTSCTYITITNDSCAHIPEQKQHRCDLEVVAGGILYLHGYEHS